MTYENQGIMLSCEYKVGDNKKCDPETPVLSVFLNLTIAEPYGTIYYIDTDITFGYFLRTGV